MARWIFGSKIEKEDRGVGSSPLSSRSIMSSPSVQRKENHYSNDAVEKANENREKYGNSTLDHFLRQDEDDFNFFWQKIEVVRWKSHTPGFHFHPLAASGTPIRLLGDHLRSDCVFFVNFNFRVLRSFHLLSRRHRSKSDFPLDARIDWTWWRSRTQREAPNSSNFLFNFWSKDPPCYLKYLPWYLHFTCL